jgi:DNA-binding CsgD family transcriptional regulator
MQSARAHANHATPALLGTPLGDAAAVRAAVARLAGSAGSELCLLVRSRLDRRRLAPESLLSAAAGRGVRIRVIEELAGAGGSSWPAAEVRTVPRVPSRLLIADASRAVVLPPVDAGDAGVALGRSPLLATLTETFELLWDTAAGDPHTAPGARDAAILALLAKGLADDEVAQQLGTSARTVRRRVAALMRAGGTTTRFQAGAEAVRRGWL